MKRRNSRSFLAQSGGGETKDKKGETGKRKRKQKDKIWLILPSSCKRRKKKKESIKFKQSLFLSFPFPSLRKISFTFFFLYLSFTTTNTHSLTQAHTHTLRYRHGKNIFLLVWTVCLSIWNKDGTDKRDWFFFPTLTGLQNRRRRRLICLKLSPS